ncbi:MAG: AAA family ATPase [Clostridia bacterium]|nr:AAA family ATPase [Clostridia bacterium]
MEKSLLLDSLIKHATQMSESDKKRCILADYFVLTLMYALRAQELGSLNEFLKVQSVPAETLAEFEDLKNLLAHYGVKAEAVADRIARFLTVDRPKTLAGALLFNKITSEAERFAESRGKTAVTADMFVYFLLQNPTEVVNRFFINANVEETPTNNNNQSISDFFTGKPNFEPAEETPIEPKEEEPEEISWESLFDAVGTDEGERQSGRNDAKKGLNVAEGKKQLISTIDKVKDAQAKLLEVVYGQDQAVNTFISGYFQAELSALTQDKRNRPRATFLFAGPPGVGKTFLAETAAETLGLPFKRFDMSEYADKEANIEFCGSDKVYKNGKAGNVTSFVSENPHSILLFDEIEKAHLNVIYLFLQMLDAGRLRDNFTDEEVSFVDTIIIFTTNVGKRLYEDPTIVNLSGVSKKTVLKELSADMNPVTNTPYFPSAICSRFASGNVVMFNHLGAHNLLKIVDREIDKHTGAFSKKTGIRFTVDGYVPYALMFAEGGKADARTVRGKTANFVYQEMYELFRLASSKKGFDMAKVEEIRMDVDLPDDEKIRSFFAEAKQSEVLVFASGELAEACKKNLKGVKVHCTDSIARAKDILFDNDISVIFCDVKCNMKDARSDVLNVEDADSVGRDFFAYAKDRISVPLYLIEKSEGDISQEEFLSFSGEGARGVVAVEGDDGYDFSATVIEKCNIAYQQQNLLELAKANKVISYKTAQKISDDGKTASIVLFDFEIGLAMDAEDSKNVLSNVSKPDARFEKVIGAEDAKSELKYFVEYLKNPVKFLRKGVRAPKGVLLYGPPGTGKTLLAKAMAGESDVTFITAEGNQFLKKFVGEGAEKVHELFNTARKYAPSILFIDEIDVVGKERKGESGSETSADVLTAFLTEMDGFKVDTDKPVFVLAATNYDIDPDSNRKLDAALLRRFDRKILVDLPNKEERARYLRLKMSGNKNLQISDEQVDNIAIRSTGMSLADLESVIELALRDAIKAEDFIVTDLILENAFESYNSGEVKKWETDSLERTARHEAGHALLCWLGGETPSYLTIVARGSHGGYMQHGDNEGKGMYTKEELLARVRTSLAGRAAEVVYYGEKDGVSTGPSGDLRSATRIVEQMICYYGMDEKIGLASVDLGAMANSEYASVVRERVNEVLNEEYAKTVAAVLENKAAIDKIVEALMEKNQMKGDEIDAIFKKYANKIN